MKSHLPELVARIDKAQRDWELLEFERSLRGLSVEDPGKYRGLMKNVKRRSGRVPFAMPPATLLCVLVEARNERLAQVRENWPDLPAIRLANSISLRPIWIRRPRWPAKPRWPIASIS